MKIENFIINHFTKQIDKTSLVSTRSGLILLAVLFFIFALINFYSFASYERPNEDDFITKKFTFQKMRVKNHLTRLPVKPSIDKLYIETNEFSGDLVINRVSHSLFDVLKEDLKIGDTIYCKIHKSYKNSFFNIKSINIWGLTTNTKRYMSVKTTIEYNVRSKTFWAPLLSLIAVFISLYGFIGLIVIRKYHETEKVEII